MAEMPSRTRIVLALDFSPRSQAALTLAAALAIELDAELAGLFVEDVDLLHVGSLPFTREVGLLSAVSRPVNLQEVELALRREAEVARRLLAEAASRARLRWSFRVARGRIATELFGLVSDPDLIVLGKRARVGMRLLGDALKHAPTGSTTPGPVLAVCDGSSSGRRALQLAARQARTAGAELHLLLPAASAQEFTHRATEAIALLRDSGPAPSCCRLIMDNIGDIAAAACCAGASVLVLNGDGRLRGGADFATLLNEIDCPVLLVG
jgi:nucleotide-binding universal stress UspA family protein